MNIDFTKDEIETLSDFIEFEFIEDYGRLIDVDILQREIYKTVTSGEPNEKFTAIEVEEKRMNTYTVYLFDSTKLEIKADDYTVYKGDEVVKFIKDDENIAWFSLRSIAGFLKNEKDN